MQFNIPAHLTGLTDKEVELSRLKFGINQKKQRQETQFLVG